MSSSINFLKVISSIFNNKVEKKTNELITENPEVFLNEAIKNEINILNENRDKLSKVRTLLNENQKNKEELISKIQSIQALINKYQREGNLEAVKAGNEKYAMRYKELEILSQTVDKLEESYNTIKEIVTKQQTKINTLEAKKASLIGQLKASESQEEAINLLNSLNLSNENNKTFESIEKKINQKINNINGKVDVQKDLDKEDYFKNL